MTSRFIHREQPSAFDLHLRSHHLVTNNTVYILAGNIRQNNISSLIINFLEGCLMTNKERELVAAITTERQQQSRGKSSRKSTDEHEEDTARAKYGAEHHKGLVKNIPFGYIWVILHCKIKK